METKKKGDTKANTGTDEVKCPLENRRVKVWPIKRARGLVQDPEHEASFLFGTAINELTVPLDRNGRLKDPLTANEREWFEEYDKELNLEKGDTSINGKNMWIGYKIQLDKSIRILDLSDPRDYIDYKVLLVNTDKIAPSWAEKDKKATYLYALVDEESEEKEEASRADKMRRAYEHFGRISEDPDEMKKFLRIYGRQVAEDSKVNWLKSQLQDIIDTDLKGYLNVAEDEDYDMKDFINRAIKAGAIIKQRNQYKLPGGEVIARSIKELIDYLRANENQDIYIDIESKVEASK